MLFPLPEPGLLALDLLGETFTKGFLFLFEFGIVRLLHSGFAELPGLHLLLAVVLIVNVLSCGDQVKHVRANQARPQLSEIAVVLVLNCGNNVIPISLSRIKRSRHTFCDSPKVLPTLDNTTVSGSDIFGGSNDRERHGIEKYSSVFSSGLVIGIDGRLVDADALSSDHFANLHKVDRVGVRSLRRHGGFSLVV